MSFSRRIFLRTGTFAILGGAAMPAWSKAPIGPRLVLSEEERAVVEWLGAFSRGVRLVGSAVHERCLGRTPGRAHWRAEVKDAAGLAAELSRVAGTTGVFSSGDTIYFPNGECEMIVELARNAKRASFAHETLEYDPASGVLSDTFGVAGAQILKIVRRGSDLAEVFGMVLHGRIEARRLGLVPDAEFRRLENRVLGTMPGRGSLARAVARTVLGRLATWSAIAPAEEVAAVMSSRLVTGSFRATLGVDPQAIRADSAGAWIAALLDPASLAGTGRNSARAWLASGDYFDRLRTQAALAEARSLTI